jgi:hypothetical protein
MRPIKKVLFFSYQRGSANCLVPLYKRIKSDERFLVHLYGGAQAGEKYNEEHVPYKNLDAADLQLITALLKKEKPDIIVTGTSDNVERLLWQVGAELKIKTVAILDHWTNYQKRFLQNDTLVFPDVVCVMDKFAKNEMEDLGFPIEKIKVTGQPNFQVILEDARKLTITQKEQFRKKYGKKGFPMIVFAPDPINQEKFEVYGYTQTSILENILQVIGGRFPLLVKLHPANSDMSIFQKYKKEHKITIIENMSEGDVIEGADIILGMFSMFLVEAVLRKKPIISIQIGLKGKDPFVLSRKGLVTTIVNQKDLDKALEECIATENYNQYMVEFEYINNPIERIIKVIDEI